MTLSAVRGVAGHTRLPTAAKPSEVHRADSPPKIKIATIAALEFEGDMFRLGRSLAAATQGKALEPADPAREFGGSALSLGRSNAPAAAYCWKHYVAPLHMVTRQLVTGKRRRPTAEGCTVVSGRGCQRLAHRRSHRLRRSVLAVDSSAVTESPWKFVLLRAILAVPTPYCAATKGIVANQAAALSLARELLCSKRVRRPRQLKTKKITSTGQTSSASRPPRRGRRWRWTTILLMLLRWAAGAAPTARPSTRRRHGLDTHSRGEALMAAIAI